MKRFVFGWLAAGMLFGGAASAEVVLQDGFEGPWYLPDIDYDFNTDGAGFDEDWFVDHVSWVGDNQFQFDSDSEIKTEGQYAQKANSSVNDGNIRDLNLARLVPGAVPGESYRISLDYRFDKGDQNLHIQFTVRDGDQRSQAAVGDIENYSGHERPDTLYADTGTFGDGEFHTLTITHTPAEGETSFTFLMIVRFQASDLETNWLWLDNFVVEHETPTSVVEWSLF